MAQVQESVKIVAETEGFDKATAAAQKLEGALDGVAKTADKTTATLASTGKGYASLVRQIDPAFAAAEKLSRAQEVFKDRLDRGKLSLDDYNRLMGQAQARWGGSAITSLGNLTKAVNDNKNAFGLTGYQVQNLGFQLNDVITQLSLGQSVFRTMASQGGQVVQILGQNENGIGGTLKGIRSGILGLGPAALIGFGVTGVLGAATAAALGIKSLRKEIEALEAPIRAFNTPAAADRILAGARSVSTGTNLTQGDVLGLEQLAQRKAGNLGLTDPTALTRGAASLSQGMRATAEQSREAIKSLEQLLSLQHITGEQAVKFAKDFPQFADAIAAAFNTSREKLLDLDPALIRTNAVVAREIAKVGASAGEGSTKVKDLWQATKDAAVAFDNATGFTRAWDASLGVLAKTLGVVTQALEQQAAAAERAAAKAMPQTAGGLPVDLTGPNDPRLRTTSASDPLSRFYSQYNSPGEGKRGQPTYPEQYGPPIPVELSPNASRTLEEVADKIAPVPEWRDEARLVQENLKQQARYSQEGLIHTQATADGVIRVYDAAKLGTDATKSADKNNTSGLSAVEQAIRALPGQLPSGGGAPAPREATYSYRDQYGFLVDNNLSYEEALELQRRERNDPSYKYGGPNQGGQKMQFALPEGFTLAGNGFNGYKLVNTNTPMAQAIQAIKERRDPVAVLKEFGLLGGTAAGTAPLSAADLGSVTSPIAREIERLRDLQGAVMGRAYTPDPYSDKNPDYFYAGGSIFKAEQDKQFDALQDQIDKLDDIASLSAQLVNQNANLPQMLVNALLAAGFGNIAAEIASAITRSTTSTTTTVSNPQTGFLPNRGETSRMLSSSFFGRV